MQFNHLPRAIIPCKHKPWHYQYGPIAQNLLVFKHNFTH